MINIRKAHLEDRDEIWNILHLIIQQGNTYVFYAQSSKEDMLAYWCGMDKNTYIALFGDQIAGTFIIKDNQPGYGSHIANASYMVLPEMEGRGIGTAMAEFSFSEAKKLGYKAMQYNIVIKSNKVAVHIWQKLGFEIIGEIPEAFHHSQQGYINAYIMYKKL